MNARRVRSASARSESTRAPQCGRANCAGWCTRSPVITASSPRERTCTDTCPGVWPGVGSRLTAASTA